MTGQLESAKSVRGGDKSGKEGGDSEVGSCSSYTIFLLRDFERNFFIQIGGTKESQHISQFFSERFSCQERKIWVIPTMTDPIKNGFCLNFEVCGSDA